MINVVRRSNQLKSKSNTHLVTKRGGIKNTFPAVQLFQRFLITWKTIVLLYCLFFSFLKFLHSAPGRWYRVFQDSNRFAY